MKELPFVIVVNVDGDLKSIRPEEFNDAVRLVIDTALVDVLNGRAGRVRIRTGKVKASKPDNYYWSTASDAPDGAEG